MKKNIFLFIAIPLFSFATDFFQICNDINSALKTGNSKSIASFISSSIELNLPSNDGLFSKPQAEAIIKDFFSKNTPKSYTVKHEGNSKDGSKFVIGALETSTGSYRTYYFVKTVGGATNLKELRIEKE